MVLSLDADDVVFAGPFLRLRAIIVIKKDDASDLQTLVSIVRYDPLTQTVEPLVQCVGPSADDPDTEFNGTCPQTQQTTTVDP